MFQMAGPFAQVLYFVTHIAPAERSIRPGPERITMSQFVSAVSDSTFDEEIGGSTEPVVVDFWAEWCGPCKMVAPVLDEIAQEQSGKIAVRKLNVDENPEIARRYQVMSIPTMIVFKDGQEAGRIVGAKGKGQLLQEINGYI
jgi:thioredoxin 1